jgi:hypothetical protein
VLADDAGTIDGSRNGGDSFVFGNNSANTLHCYGFADVRLMRR